MNSPASLVSVVVPVFNAQTTILPCVHSILAQSYPHLEVLLVDDGSRDQSSELLHTLALEEPRVRVFSKPNGGVATARNLALDNARGTYIQFVDSDDILPPTATAALVSAMESQGCDLAIGRYHEFLGGRRRLCGYLKNDMVLSLPAFLKKLSMRPNSFYYAVLWNKLYRRDIIEKNQIRCDPTLPWGEDFAFNTRYWAHMAFVAVLGESVYDYTRNPTGLSVTTGLKAVIHPIRGIRIKLTLHRHYQRLFQEAGLYEDFRHVLPLYLFGVTLGD